MIHCQTPAYLTLKERCEFPTGQTRRLLCVGCHTGTLESGHYITYCIGSHRGNDAWFEVNDSQVRKLGGFPSLRQALGGLSSRGPNYTPTILVYGPVLAGHGVGVPQREAPVVHGDTEVVFKFPAPGTRPFAEAAFAPVELRMKDLTRLHSGHQVDDSVMDAYAQYVSPLDCHNLGWLGCRVPLNAVMIPEVLNLHG